MSLPPFRASDVMPLLIIDIFRFYSADAISGR